MKLRADNYIEYGPYRLYDDGRLCCADGKVEQLARRLQRPLAVLMEARGCTVTKDQLLEQCWPRSEMGDENLARSIADLRKLLRPHGDNPLRTVYGVGYRMEAVNEASLEKSQQDNDDELRKTALLYAEARHRIHARRMGSLDVAERLLREQAMMRDAPDIWLAVAETHVNKIQLGYASVQASWPHARFALERALKGKPAEAMAMMALGLCWTEWDFTTAGEMLARARGINPADYAVNECCALREVMVGNNDLAIDYFRRAIKANPVALPPRGWISLTLSMMGQAGEALAVVHEMARLDHESPVFLAHRALVETRWGDPEMGLVAAGRSVAVIPDSPVAAAILAYALSASGRGAVARTVLERPSISGEPLSNVSSLACWAWLRLEEPRRALTTLQHGFERHCPYLPVVLRDRALAPIANDQSFRDIFSAVFGEDYCVSRRGRERSC
jgi:DNA-binding winged helix-turn-helix (wHTH) protein/Flp pilus assembly protein TadD